MLAAFEISHPNKLISVTTITPSQNLELGDSRIVRKPYGRVFLDSLPPARRLIGDRRTATAALRQFFVPNGQS